MFIAMTSASANSYRLSWACLAVAASGSSKALCRNGKVSENPILWHWLLTHDLEILAVDELHVFPKFHKPKCSGSWVIVLTEKNEQKTLWRCWKQKGPAVAREDALQPIQFLLHTDLQGHLRSMIFISCERAYATFC